MILAPTANRRHRRSWKIDPNCQKLAASTDKIQTKASKDILTKLGICVGLRWWSLKNYDGEKDESDVDNDDGDLDDNEDNDEDHMILRLMKVVNVNMVTIMMTAMISKSHSSC